MWMVTVCGKYIVDFIRDQAVTLRKNSFLGDTTIGVGQGSKLNFVSVEKFTMK